MERAGANYLERRKRNERGFEIRAHGRLKFEDPGWSAGRRPNQIAGCFLQLRQTTEAAALENAKARVGCKEAEAAALAQRKAGRNVADLNCKSWNILVSRGTAD
jgi:hypothetical protein